MYMYFSGNMLLSRTKLTTPWHLADSRGRVKRSAITVLMHEPESKATLTVGYGNPKSPLLGAA